MKIASCLSIRFYLKYKNVSFVKETKPLSGTKFIYLRSLLLNCIHEA